MIIKCFKKDVTIVLVSLSVLVATPCFADTSPVRIKGAGLTPYMSIKAAPQFVSNCSPRVKSILVICWWEDMEPENGTFEFASYFNELIKQAHEKEFHIMTMIWVGPNSPKWIYEDGVPLVKSSKNNWDFPYYFSERYNFFLRRMINAFADYIRNLPKKDRALFVGHQIAEGSTGDTSGYGGKVNDPKYEINNDEWRDYRLKVWQWYLEAFQEGDHTLIPFMFTDDANTDLERDWQIENLAVFGAKKGQFGHGYNNNDNGERLTTWNAFQKKAQDKGKTIFARGEFDKILLRAGWVKKDTPMVFYWSMLMALHTNIDFWNPADVLFNDERLHAAMDFYNTYAGWKDPSKAPGAFCALRKTLNADNIDEFPESEFGRAARPSTDRYVAIQKAYADRGARIEDLSVINKHAIACRRRKGINDVGWDFTPGNFERYLVQINPDTTSIGWWNIHNNSEVYGRFARSTDFKTGKTQMFFRFAKGFFLKPEGNEVIVKITWFDEHPGSWSLCYPSAESGHVKKAGIVTGSGIKKWQTAEFVIKDADFSASCENNCDLIIQHEKGLDTKFHMIEAIRN